MHQQRSDDSPAVRRVAVLSSFCVASAISCYVFAGVCFILVLLATLFKAHTDRSVYEYSYAAAISHLPSSELASSVAARHRPAVGSADDLAVVAAEQQQKKQQQQKQQRPSPPASWLDPPLESALSSNFFTGASVRCVALPPGAGYLFIAANLHNSEEVLPVWLREMKRLLLMLTACDRTADELRAEDQDEDDGNSKANDSGAKSNAPRGATSSGSFRTSRVFVSVFTNKCADRTNEILADNFIAWLRRHRIPHDLRLGSKIEGKYESRPDGMQRIEWLSKVRNAAIAPLVQHGARLFLVPQGGDYTTATTATATEKLLVQEQKAQQRRSKNAPAASPAFEAVARIAVAAVSDAVASNVSSIGASGSSNAASAASPAAVVVDKTRAQPDVRRFSQRVPSLTDVRVLFVNDIVFTAEDMLLLLHTNGGAFDMACGLDFYFNFYDSWVARDTRGRPFWAAPPFSAERALSDAVRRLAPARVGCCWNGAVVTKARVFVTESFDQQRFDVAKRLLASLAIAATDGGSDARPALTAAALPLLQQYFFGYAPNIVFRWSCVRCCLSECSLLCRDLRRPEFGAFGNILMNPLVRVAYESPDYIGHRGGSFLVGFYEATAWIFAEFNKNFLFAPQALAYANATEGALAFLIDEQMAAAANTAGGHRAVAKTTPAPNAKVRMTSEFVDAFDVPLDDQYEACFNSAEDAAQASRVVLAEAVLVVLLGTVFGAAALAMLVRFALHRRVPVFASWRFFQMLRCRPVSRGGLSLLFPHVVAGGVSWWQRVKALWACCCFCDSGVGGGGAVEWTPQSPVSASPPPPECMKTV